MKIVCEAFEQMKDIPSQFTCDGLNINPRIQIQDVPEGTKSLLLIMDDPDSPSGDWTHWIVWNIAPDTTIIEENAVPQDSIQGKNSWNEEKYGGPCPGKGKHRYVFTLYALDMELKASAEVERSKIEEMMLGRIIAKAEYIGMYERIQT